MSRAYIRLVCLSAINLLAISSAAFASVAVSSPSNGATVQAPVHFVASASSSCSKGVSAMGIYTADGVLAYKTSGAKLDTSLNLSPGTYKTTVQEWDNCGGADKVTLTITVSGQSGVNVISPANNSNVASTVQYVATATTSCSKGVSAMGIYTAPGVLAYRNNGASLNTSLNLNPGTYNTTVQSWDNCGGAAKTPITIKVGGGSSGVQVSTPANNATVSSPVQFKATASTSCAKGVAAMGLYPTPGWLIYAGAGASLNTAINLNPGSYTVIAQEWDNCGGVSKTPVTINVGSSTNEVTPSTAKSFTNLHAKGGWTGYALLPPDYPICSSCLSAGPQTTWWMGQGIASPSMSGNSTQFDIGGKTVYSDVLWNNHLIGDFSSQGLPDTVKTLVPSLHNFVYDVYFYGANLEVSEALEFDLNQFVNGKSFIWGHECRIQGGHEWDIWDNVGNKWIKTGIPCKPVSNQWNHLVLRVQRTNDDKVLFQSIELNGQVYNVNHLENPTATNWYGVTVNYQMDGNDVQKFYTVHLDKFNFLYW